MYANKCGPARGRASSADGRDNRPSSDLALLENQPDPAPPAPEATRPCAYRSACAGGVVVSNPATDDAIVLRPAAVRQGARMAPRLLRALEIRIFALEGEQAAAAAEYEALDLRADTILAGIADRQQRLRGFRELLLNNGKPANSTWLPEQGGGR
jgi:hypothetical protein